MARKNETEEMRLEEFLDVMVRIKVIDRIEKDSKYVNEAFERVDFKTCDAEKLCRLADAWDEVRFAMRDLVKEDK